MRRRRNGLNGKTLVEGVDYKVSMTKNRKSGTASVTITGLNGYTGKKTVKFIITK